MRRKRLSKRRPSVDKSKLTFGEQERVRDEKHKKFITTLPCVKTRKYPTEPAHISKGNNKGVSTKAGDNHIVPLHPDEHRRQHSIGEISYWGEDLDRAQQLALDLYDLSGDTEACVFRIMRFQRGEL